MITIYSEQEAAALTDPALRALIEGHLTRAKSNGLEDLTCIAVVEPADTEETFQSELGFSPLENPLTETRYGAPGFTPAWNWLEVHPAWVETIWTAGDDGFAFIVFVPTGNTAFTPLFEACAKAGNVL